MRYSCRLLFLIVMIVGPIFLALPNRSIAGDIVKPNILLIISDDQGYADLGAMPYTAADVRTPGMDHLAESGTLFTSAYITSPICSPSRTGLITGRYQQHWGNYWFSEGGLPQSELTIPQALKKLGYVTMKIGKTHHNGGKAEFPLDHGFDEFYGFVDHTHDYLRMSRKDVEKIGPKNARLAHIGPMFRNRDREDAFGYSTQVFTREAIRFITRDHGGKPFYLHLAYNAVHHPTYQVAPDYLDKWGLKQFPFWDPQKEPYNQWHMRWGWRGEEDPDGRKRYLACLNVLDDGIIEILDALKKKGLEKNTLIIYLSDNGGSPNTFANNGPLKGCKYTEAEGGIRVPMMVSWPGHLPRGAICDQVVSSLDIFPTLIDASGGTKPVNLDGKSLMPLLQGKQQGPLHDTLFWSRAPEGNWAVRAGDWKLRHVSQPKEFHGFNDVTGLFLYNLKTDPGEKNNLAEKMPAKVKELTRLYKDWLSEMSPPRKMGWRKKG